MTIEERAGSSVNAIKQVLEAEHQAELALRHCHQQARQVLEEARNEARAIEARADARIHRIHRDRQERIASLREESERHCNRLYAQSPCDDADTDLIERVVAQAVVRLLESPQEPPAE